MTLRKRHARDDTAVMPVLSMHVLDGSIFAFKLITSRADPAQIQYTSAPTMAKQSKSKTASESGAGPLFPALGSRKHPRLFLQKYLKEDAEKHPFGLGEIEHAGAILKNWAMLVKDGHMERKETEIDADFLQKIFGDALGYKSVSDSPLDYHREKNPTIAGAGIADGALGLFVSGKNAAPRVVIELKGAAVDLDHDKFSGRTPVQQCWDYLNQLPDTPWGIVSNYKAIRLYHKSHPMRAYEEFTVADFLDPDRLKQFYYVFEKNGLIGSKVQKPRAEALLLKTQSRQRDVGDKLYTYYSDQREQLINELIDDKKMTQDQAIHAAQRLLDRIIFIAFCEDRGLLPEKLLESTWKNVAPLARATNPRWRNFLDAFHAIDKGHVSLDLPTGFNGGLFKHDPLVDDLDLDDRWADVFKNIGEYDFREEGEISVDVLGHLFERSISELEKLRVAGLFGKQAETAIAAMPKSAERKRYGIYYTPPQFTQLIVDETLGKLIAERIDPLPDLQHRVKELRKLKIVDPACGSGAFLIAAYERLDEAYGEIARLLRGDHRAQEALNLTNEYADYILFENLYGVDLSAESVEITQLALWIRSARKGRPLTDLSNNVRRGNSLIRDKSIHPEGFDWQTGFPEIFAAGGFDVVIGNPPWERMKVQEREFFSLAAPQIASAVNAADRRKLIAKVEGENPQLWARYVKTQQAAERTLAYVRTEAANFPLTGRGDVNTYMLFAELAREIVSPKGRVGLLVPSGIATDNTTKEFFTELMESKTLASLFDFENRKLVFADVDGRFKFSVLLMTGVAAPQPSPRFVFFAHAIDELADKQRQISLTPKDLKLLNPNSRTCPIFRTRRDAELTKQVYRRIPILIDRSRETGGNPWGIRFCTMFHQTNDAELFIDGEKLLSDGFKLTGNRWAKNKDLYLPLYEAKMIQGYDHRAAGVKVAAGNWMRQGQTEESNLVEHQNPEFVVQPRYWVDQRAVSDALGGARSTGFIGFKDITSSTNRRTMIAAAIPFAAVVNHFPLILSDLPHRRQLCLLGNLNSLAYDYICRQKIGGITLNFFIVEQLPTLPPDAYDAKCPWAKSKQLEDWIAERVLKLTCTANDMQSLAKAAGFKPGVCKWKEEERAKMRAELDAAFFVLYGMRRDDIEYILTTFQGIQKEDSLHEDFGPTRSLLLDSLDKLLGSM
jgi:hypothetical protein